MRIFNIFVLSIFTILLTACYTPPKIQVTQDLSGNYVLDPAHTSIVWKIKHAGLSNYTARFDTVSGILNFDPKNPQNSEVNISIDPSSVNTGDADFDHTIGQGRQYFNAPQYPHITFISTDITITGGDNTGLIIGDLSFRGVTKQITLNVTFNGVGKSFGHKGKTLGFSAITQFNRSDFGLSYRLNFGINDEITLFIETEFNENFNG
ncbi:MAG: polyisoprenoid-binding protein [Robiginitomaculum sp.]|nr:polyisoprenoid-binding protein [Robiginitomaculum sp.]